MENLTKKNLIINNVYFRLAFLAVLFIINYFWSDFVFVSFSALLLLVCFSSEEDAFTMLIFSVPFAAISMPYSLIFLCAGILVFLVKSYIKMYVIEKKKPDIFMVIALALLFVYLLLPFSSYNKGFAVKFASFTLIFAAINLFTYFPDKLRLKLNVNILALSFVIVSALFAINILKEGLPDGGSSFRFSAFYDNPNPLGMICSICLSLIVYLTLTKKASLGSLFSFIVFAAVGLATMSKTFLIIFVLLLIILLLYAAKAAPRLAFFSFGILCLAVCLLAYFKPDFAVKYIDRFIGELSGVHSFEEVMNKITTGRYSLWQDYTHYIIENPLVLIFGAGMGAGRVSSGSAHNMYITLVYHLGIVGVALLILALIACVLAYKKKTSQKISPAAFVPFLIIGLIMFAEDLFMYNL